MSKTTVLLLGLLMASTVGCSINNYVLFPERDVTQTPEQFGLRCESIETTNASGHRVTGWLILPTRGAGENPAGSPAGSGIEEAVAPRGVILVSHGNAGNVGSFLPWAKLLSDAGYAAALYDYQGYGRSGGDADVTSLVGDGRAVVGWLRERGHLAGGRRLGLVGLSLGTLVSVKLAGEVDDVAAVALEGALIPGDELKRKFGVLGAPIAWLLVKQIPDELDTGAQIARVRAPLLFIHSADDEVTSIEGARDLFGRAPEPKRWVEVPGARHLTPIMEWPDYAATLTRFFDERLAR
ncbi:MAG: hypothetical protein BIFFINMI_01141 [Phycisphaerae bacterium]|nr:hypothetical protein [Phycisphaerae bacterium]